MSVTSVKCPQCSQWVPWTAKQRFKPFCSERCRLIDLGEWITEERRICDDALVDEWMDSQISHLS